MSTKAGIQKMLTWIDNASYASLVSIRARDGENVSARRELTDAGFVPGDVVVVMLADEITAEEAALAQRQRDRRIARLVRRAFQTGDAIPPVSDDQEQMELTN